VEGRDGCQLVYQNGQQQKFFNVVVHGCKKYCKEGMRALSGLVKRA
jgi:hypothetical protein